MLRTTRPPFLLLTVCDLQQGFGNDTAGNVESLAAIEAAIRALNVGNGQTTRLGDREAAEGLRRLVGEEETLGRRSRWETHGLSTVIQRHNSLKVELTSLPSFCQKIAG